MRRSTLLKISILLVIAIVFLSCSSLGYAASDKSRVTLRPLEEWAETNPSIFYGWGGRSPGTDTPNYLIALADTDTNGGIPPPEGTYDGYIKERKLSDGRALVTVYLSLEDAPFWLVVGVYPDDPLDSSKQIFENAKIINYREVNEFVIPFPGAPIPNIGDIAYTDWVLSEGNGQGRGIFTAWAANFGFTPGEQGMMTINQRGLIRTAFQNGFKGALGDLFPVEFINVHQIG
jgi:hypothetical protein